MRLKKPRSHTMTDEEEKKYVTDQLPYPTEDGAIHSKSGLILYALKQLPRKQ